MEIQLTIPCAVFAHDDCRKNGWNPNDSFNNYLQNIKPPEYCFDDRFPHASMSSLRDLQWFEFDRSNLFNRLRAEKVCRNHSEGPEVWSMAFEETKCFRQNANCPECGEINAERNTLIWHPNQSGAASSGALNIFLGWLCLVRPVHPQHYGIRSVPFDERWRLTANQASEQHTCSSTAYVFSWNQTLKQEIELRFTDGRKIESNREIRDIDWVEDFPRYHLPLPLLQPMMQHRHSLIDVETGKKDSTIKAIADYLMFETPKLDEIFELKVSENSTMSRMNAIEQKLLLAIPLIQHLSNLILKKMGLHLCFEQSEKLDRTRSTVVGANKTYDAAFPWAVVWMLAYHDTKLREDFCSHFAELTSFEVRLKNNDVEEFYSFGVETFYEILMKATTTIIDQGFLRPSSHS